MLEVSRALSGEKKGHVSILVGTLQAVIKLAATGDVRRLIREAIKVLQSTGRKSQAEKLLQQAIAALSEEWVVNVRRLVAKLNVASCFSVTKGIHRSTVVKTLTEAKEYAAGEEVGWLIEEAIQVLKEPCTKAEAYILVQRATAALAEVSDE